MMQKLKLLNPERKEVPERLYLWDKSWVRPYESALSVYMNFVGINALNTAEVEKYWDCHWYNSYDMFDHSINCYRRVGKNFIEKMRHELLPNDYYVFPEFGGNVMFYRGFKYCPECIKQGFHSNLSEMPFEKKCPIHKVEYTFLNKKIPIGLRGDYRVYKEYFGDFPLPPERERLDYRKLKNRIKIYKDIKSINYVSTDSDLILTDITIKRKTEIACIDNSFNYAAFMDYVWDYFTEMGSKVYPLEYMLSGFEYESIRDYFIALRKSVDEDNYDRVMELACLSDLIKDVYNSETEFKYPKDRHLIYESKNLEWEMPATVKNIKSSYCFAVRGNKNEHDVFDLRYIKNINTSTNIDVYYTKPTSLQYLCQVINALFYNCLKQPMSLIQLLTVIKTICVKDQFWFFINRYIDTFVKKKTIDFYNLWREAKPIIYEIKEKIDGTIIISRLEI